MAGLKMTRRTAAVSAGVVAALVVAGGGAYAALSPKNSHPVIQTADTAVVAVRDVEEKIQTTGQVNPKKKTAVTASISSPVTALKVAVGDRVNPDQILAELDTTALQRSIELEAATKASAQATSSGQVATARQQYQHSQQMYSQGLSPEINNAVAAQAQAEAAVAAAERDFANKQNKRAEATTPTLVEQQHAVTAARDEQRDAAVALARANAAALYSVVMAEAATPDHPLDINSAEERLARADRGLADTQQSYQRALGDVDAELAESQIKVAEAHRQASEAALAVESARLSTLHDLDTQRVAMEEAENTANAAGLTNDVTARHAQQDLGKAQVRSPHGGVVTELAAVEGAPSEGPLMTVADDSQLIVRALVKEADVARIKAGDSVRFSTPATKDKKFTGTVVKVSPAAAGASGFTGAGAAAAGAGSGTPAGTSDGNQKVEFPVEIAVTGDRDGLMLGSTAKADIVVKQQSHALVVPREAVVDSGSGYEVTVLEPDGENFRVTKLPVTVVAQTDFDAAVAATELEEGTRVLTDPRKYEDKVGQVVSMQDAGK
ncbi:efflux RND transporter periplasmic adaptor subunit [Corynebacterium epidermidicanis]|uniref:HlyD family secretion protein n=1 Tax=Corynebacterium epidermidicanis TaxID=1050174 RepID=A0A0G3GV99_9CORY|nr:HlyD family efflux transporter periplasmic adaptor subunit [Corynebacterium epidermidicanis]AKK02757.1 HlyD family secretion protein [Corynebacterium epidermidicanis]